VSARRRGGITLRRWTWCAGWALLGVALAVPLGTTGCRTQPAAAPASGPRLVLLVVADQFRADYLDRFRSAWTGGFERLLEQGVVFSDAHHFHAVTKTAPGHATLATGVHPARHGIVGNRWYDRALRRPVEAVEDDFGTLSPARLLAPGLGDWVKLADPGSRAFAASAKDRAAILLGGLRPDAAFWLDERNGRFVTGSYSVRAERSWFTAFGRERLADAWFGKIWDLLPLPGGDPARFGIEEVPEGAYRAPWPRRFGGLTLAPDASFYGGLLTSPVVDELLERFVEALVHGERLGQGSHLDYLGVSFSAVDEVGHDFGPASREVADVLLHLDLTLGRLFAFLDREVGRDRWIVAFTADHGVAPLPEQPAVAASGGRRIGTAEVVCFEQAGRELARRHGGARLFANGLTLDRDALAAARLDATAVARETAALLAACPGVARTIVAADLAPPAVEADPLLSFFRHSHFPLRSPDLYVLWQEKVLARLERGTDHGTPWPHDTHVPLVLLAPRLAPAAIGERVWTVDVAPTLAALAGVPAPAGLDGRDRSAGATRTAVRLSLPRDQPP